MSRLWSFPLTLSVVTSLSPATAQRSESELARDAVAAAADLGESAPDWLVDSESYAIGYDPNGWEALAASKVAFVTHCPINRDYFERVHALGVRAFPYITMYQGRADATYEGINLKDHPEFIEIDEGGNLRRTGFWESEDAKNMYTTCPNVPAYQDAMVEWVRRIMELGADGVFVDNLAHRAECFGSRLGKHEHLYEDQDHAFAMLLGRVREVVKQYKTDGAVLGNSASPLSLPREFWKFLDAEMLESYICTWVSKERWFSWPDHWHKQGVDLQPFVRAGKQIQALSYLGHTPYGVREDGFFCYASARLAGFVWNGGRSLSDPDTAILYQIRLGKPLDDEREENGVFYRVFERGMVAVNPDREKPGAITVAAPIPATRLVDLAAVQAQGWSFAAPRGNVALDSAQVRSGGQALRIGNTAPDECLASQTVVLNQEQPVPITASGWSRAQDAAGDRDGNYSIYLDIAYTDGTSLFGQIAPFSVGTHDWESSSVTVQPEKPIRSLTVNAIFRYRTGTVWFDDISLVEGEAAAGAERLRNGGFEDVSRTGLAVDVASTGGQLIVPPYSGRVYLYGSDVADQLTIPGPTLRVATRPGLGEVRFRVDGFDYFTKCGMWTTEYTLGPDFGTFSITFDAPGRHTIEIIDVVPADMKTPAGYGSGERLGQFMDPSQPTAPSGGKKFRFREWVGPVASRDAQFELDVQENTTLTAEFDVEKPQ